MSEYEVIGHIFLAVFGGMGIMAIAGWISWGGRDTRIRILGGLFGGLTITGLWIYWVFGWLPLT